MMFKRYEPPVHTGTRDEQILGLLTEYVDLENCFPLRLQAKNREQARIVEALKDLSVELWDNEDDGYLAGRDLQVTDQGACTFDKWCRCHFPWIIKMDGTERAKNFHE